MEESIFIELTAQEIILVLMFSMPVILLATAVEPRGHQLLFQHLRDINLKHMQSMLSAPLFFMKFPLENR